MIESCLSLSKKQSYLLLFLLTEVTEKVRSDRRWSRDFRRFCPLRYGTWGGIALVIWITWSQAWWL